MRKLDRLPLSKDAQSRLESRTKQIREAASDHEDDEQRFLVQKKEAQRLWAQENTVAFLEIEMVLKRMAPDEGRCMYCQYNEGSAIDHFWPLAVFPVRAYDWHNYLWSCSVCNSNYKGDRFPRDRNGYPLLLDPTVDEPRDHLYPAPSTGQVRPRTCKGAKSIRTLGLNRGMLCKDRKAAWDTAQKVVELYARYCAEGNGDGAGACKSDLQRHPLSSGLRDLLGILKTPGAKHFIGPRCLAALRDHPEIEQWVQPAGQEAASQPTLAVDARNATR
ncbi:hypothetical protein [Polyangium jinanense]|uniref:TIGR02646 family protein n=1 Tax=Polyangium jinanense TaxID=2829994 RepID=A0A9X3XB28_9BACT|nr:hypothetical protein [Polyangium jinanense]MDC3956442.1 hypothetical protein [Polyangium jinanense]MDC3985473.1 hypothetical protein [Polyangium jinanense]